MATYTPDEFADALLASLAKVPREAVAIVRKGSDNVKDTARHNVRMTAPVHNAHAYTAINYDVDVEGGTVVGEIGYDKSQRAGRIGNLLEFGGGGDHSPPHHDLARALAKEEPGFVRAVEEMSEDVLPE